MAADLKPIARQYIEAVGNKDFHRVAGFLHPDVEFTTPGGKTLRGAADYIAALRRLGPVLLRNEIHRVFQEGDEVVTVYDFVTDSKAGAIPSVESLVFAGDKIRNVRLIFHSAPWPIVLDALKEKVAATA